VKLLGEPDSVKTSPFETWDMIYWLGPDVRDPFGALDYKYLVLRLGPLGVVTEFEVTVD
jgi:hypothetical protein